MNKGQFEVQYEFVQDEKALEDVFSYIFDEVQKIINSKQIDEQKVSIYTTTI
jgi:hypothetical protein